MGKATKQKRNLKLKSNRTEKSKIDFFKAIQNMDDDKLCQIQIDKNNYYLKGKVMTGAFWKDFLNVDAELEKLYKKCNKYH